MKNPHFPKIVLAASLLVFTCLMARAGVGAWTTGNWSSGFTAASDNLIGGLSPSASSGLSNNEGGKNVKLLTDGRGASAKSDVQCIGNNAVLTYTLPQASRVNEIRIYAYWADQGRDRISVSSVVLDYAGGVTETVSPAAVSYQNGDHKAYAYLAMADGTPLGREVTSVTINFDAQEANYAGYAEIEICGSVGADDLFSVEGSPGEYGDVLPSYGEHRGNSVGDTFVCAASPAWTNQAGTVIVSCIGYKVYTNSFLYAQGDGTSFTYVHPDSVSGAHLVWQWETQYLVSANAGAGGSVSPASQWVAAGGTATVVAAGDATHGFYQWTGDLPAGVDAYSPTATFQVTGPVALTATFAAACFVAENGSDGNDGLSWATAFATVEHALSEAADGSTIFVGPGTYSISTTLALDRFITIQGAGATFADVTLDAGKARRVAVLSHARAVLRNLTLANGYSGSTGTGGGGGCVRVTAGLVENCRITGGKVVRQGYGAGVFNNGGTIRDCVIDDNTAAGNIFGGLGLYQEGAASVTERCVITNNYYSACHNNATLRCSAGLYLAGGLVRDTLVARNDAGELTEAGVSGNGASGVYQTGGTLLNCAIVENRFTKTSMAAIDCAGLYRTGGSVINCIVYGNVDGFGNPNDWKGAASFTSSVLSTTAGATGEGNVAASSAPYLILADGTFLLPQSSCAVNAGSAHANLGVTDLYGNARRNGETVDAGPVEYTTPARLVAYFEASVTEGASPLATTLSAIADGPDLTGLTYTWTFSDGTTTTTETTSSATLAHTFATGTHTISLSVSNGAGDTASLVRENYVLVRPLVAYVDPNNTSGAAFPYDTPETAATTIAAALEPQVNGLTVHLLPGIHPITAEVVVKRAVRILGDDPATTSIRGGGKHRLFYLSGPVSAGGAFLSGVTLANGYAPDGAANDNSWAKGGGGSLWIDVGSTASNCVVVGGSGVRGAAGYGVYVGGGTFTHSTIRDITTASSGTSQDISYGTALRVVKDGLVDSCVVSNINDRAHHQNYCGAAVLLTSGTIRNSLVTDVDFFYVSTTTGKKLASAVKVDGGTLDACTIVGNHVNDCCAGVYSTGGTIRNCLIAENANDDGATDAEWLRDSGTWSYVATTYTNGLPGTGHQLVSPPVYVAATFQPTPGSAAIGNALVEDWMTGALDLAGNPRLGKGGVADIGAFTYVVPSLACSITAGATVGLDSLDTTITSTIDGDATGIVYYWDTDGDGAADEIGPGLSSLSISLDTPGSYTVTLCVTNGAGIGASSEPLKLLVSPKTVYVLSGNAGAAFPYSSWANAAASIEDGLAVAVSGTEIIVADGTYALTNALVLNVGVNIHSVGGSADSALIRCAGDFRAVFLDNADAVFRGFTVSNGCLGASSAPDSAAGGGDLLLNAGLVEKCRFTEARAERSQKGVAVAVAGGTMRDCEIDGNHPRYHGYSAGQWSEIYYGVGLHLSGGLVERCKIHHNHLAEAHRNFNSTPGVYMTGGTLRGCLIADNTTEDGREGSDNKLVSGLYISGGKVVNCTIAGNRAEQYVGGVRATGGNGAGTIRNSIVYGNTNTNGVSNTAGADVFAYCCLDSVEGRAGTGMLAADPLFRRPGAGDYRLDAASPCKAAGLYDATWMADFIDLAGLPLASRRLTVPMGCFATAKGGTVIFMR